MHINEVERILRDSVSGQENRYEIKRYCDHICCESDFVLLRDGLEYAYLKYDAAGQMSRKAMGTHEEKMGSFPQLTSHKGRSVYTWISSETSSAICG